MKNKHGGYELVAYDTVFYRGYCCDRDIDKRRKEHIAAAVSPSPAEQENRIVRGGPSKKDEWILAAIEDGEEIIIRSVVVKELHEIFDEEEFIEEGRQLGYPMTNKGIGGVWQPFSMVNGELVPTEHHNEVELRNEIGEWKKVRKSKTKTPVPTIDTDNMTKAEKEAYRKQCVANGDKVRELFKKHFGELDDVKMSTVTVDEKYSTIDKIRNEKY
jgi:hypothetical protein